MTVVLGEGKYYFSSKSSEQDRSAYVCSKERAILNRNKSGGSNHDRSLSLLGQDNDNCIKYR